jgi:hypothetical protein
MIALMDVFNNLRVKKYKDLKRTDSDRTVAVPIVTHNSLNFANLVASTQTSQEPMPVPIIGFRFAGNNHDQANMVQPCYAREILSTTLNRFIRDIQPVPQVFKFEMTVLSNDLSDYFQLKENIEAYFNTYRTVRIKEFDFAPEIERQIPFTVTWSDTIEDEKNSDSKEYQYYKTTYTIEAHGVYHRKYEIPAIIKYAQMNFNINNELMDSLQVFVYPDEIARQKKHLWETIEPSIREGWSLLKTFTRTLVRKTDNDGDEIWKDDTMKSYDLTYHTDDDITQRNKVGNVIAGYNPILKGYKRDANGNFIKDKDGDLIPIYDWEDVVVEDVNRPVEVPSFDLIHLNFDEDSEFEHDFSGMNRDFVAVNSDAREFKPDMAPGNGNYTPDGYTSATDWSQILNWFGDNKEGKIESSYTFKATVQFKYADTDTVFQYLFNPEDVTLSDGTVVPKESVWFDWGIQDGRLYFTYHTTSQYKRFVSAKVDFDTTTIYSIYFVLYNEGQNGAFGIRTNFSDTMIAIETKEDK